MPCRLHKMALFCTSAVGAGLGRHGRTGGLWPGRSIRARAVENPEAAASRAQVGRLEPMPGEGPDESRESEPVVAG